jgi:hypothetical protein
MPIPAIASSSVVDLIGKTPLLRMDRLVSANSRVEIYAKGEFQNPGGSVKDRAAAAIIAEGERSGRLHAGLTILDATSGNTGIAYAAIRTIRIATSTPTSTTTTPTGARTTTPRRSRSSSRPTAGSPTSWRASAPPARSWASAAACASIAVTSG